jgi:hypothetical protein
MRSFIFRCPGAGGGRNRSRAGRATSKEGILPCRPICYNYWILISGCAFAMAIPYGKIDFESEASKLYESDEREQSFAAAYDRFPKYQSSQLFDAIDWIMDGFADKFAAQYAETDWEAISGHLGEHVHNGLT